LKLTLPYPPSSNRYWKVWRGRAVVSAEAKSYKQGVRLRALTEGFRKPLACPLVLSLVVYRPRKAGDLSNRIKVLEDALNGIAWIDDKQIVEIHARREDDASNPRVEVRIEEAK
jgi:crossover junction endodeoxyribonuclease RusA